MDKNLATRVICALLFAVVIGLASGYQILGTSRDFDNYLLFFDLVRSAPDYWNLNYRFEPGFTAVVYWLVNLHLNDYVVYSIIAGIIVFIKYFSIERTEKYWYVIFVFTFYFLARYVVLFEMTVLRAACAMAIAFYVFYRKRDWNLRLPEFLLLALAVLFHYSAVVFFVVYFAIPKGRAGILVLSGVAFVLISVTKQLALVYLPEYVSVFQTYTEFERTTIFPVPFMVDTLFLAFALWFLDEADVPMQFAVFGMALSIAFHFSLLEYSILATRFRELLSVFFLIYLVRAVSCENRLIVNGSLAFAVVTAMLNIYVNFFYTPLLS